MGIRTINENYPDYALTVFTSADATNPKQILFAGTAPDCVDAIMVSSSDTVAREVQLILASTSYVSCVLGSGTVPAGAGYAGAPSVDILPLCLPATVGQLNVQPGWTLSLAFLSAITAAKFVNVTVVAGQV